MTVINLFWIHGTYIEQHNSWYKPKACRGELLLASNDFQGLLLIIKGLFKHFQPSPILTTEFKNFQGFIKQAVNPVQGCRSFGQGSSLLWTHTLSPFYDMAHCVNPGGEESGQW